MIDQLMHTDYIKKFAKSEKEQEILIQIIKIYSLAIGMEFGIKNIPFLLMVKIYHVWKW